MFSIYIVSLIVYLSNNSFMKYKYIHSKYRSDIN